MLSPLRNRFGIPGVISVIALVFAMLGGAYAASSSDDGKATASAKAKKGPRGPRGPAGPAGPAGPQGSAGAKGDTGAAGANGKDGTNGTNGTNGTPGAPGDDGKSIVSLGSFSGAEEEPPNEGPCDGAGGQQYEIEEGDTQIVCNGAQGAQGKEGSPWTAGGTLPPGATETGTWAFNGTDADPAFYAPISFPILLTAGISGEEASEKRIHYQDLPTSEAFKLDCPGTATFPKAKPGHLCVYYNTFGAEPVNVTFTRISSPQVLEEAGAGKAGAVVQFAYSGPAEGVASGAGTWAVTGCSSTLPEGDPNKCP